MLCDGDDCDIVLTHPDRTQVDDSRTLVNIELFPSQDCPWMALPSVQIRLDLGFPLPQMDLRSLCDLPWSDQAIAVRCVCSFQHELVQLQCGVATVLLRQQ